MNFKDVDKQEIIKFLTLNNQPIDCIYNDAIELINNDNDIIMIESIESWVIAYEFKDHSIKPYYTNTKDLSYYKNLFNMGENQTIQILKYLHLYIDNYDYLSSMPSDIIKVIISKLEDYENIKCISRQFNTIHKNLDKHFIYEWGKNLLIRHHYDSNINYHMMDNILEVLNPKAGKLIYVNGKNMINFTYPELITKVMDLDGHGFLTKSGKLVFMNNKIANLSHVSNIIYHIDHNKHYILSKGKVYTCPSIILYNMYSYNSRCNYDNYDLSSLPIDNIINIIKYKDEIYMLNTNGQLFNSELELMYENVKQCCADEFLYIIKYNNILVIDMVETEYKYKKLINGPKILLISEDNQAYIFNGILTLYNLPNIISGSINNNDAFLINNNHELYKITNGNIKNTGISNVINVTLIDSDPLQYYIIY